MGRAWQLGLESVPGVSRARVTDSHTPGCRLLPGEALVEVWGGEPGEVRRVIEVHRGDLRVVVVWRPSTWWVRLCEAWGWRWAKLRVTRGVRS